MACHPGRDPKGYISQDVAPEHAQRQAGSRSRAEQDGKRTLIEILSRKIPTGCFHGRTRPHGHREELSSHRVASILLKSGI